ncbi:MAG: DJ-1/PfpI family protein [Paraglaciecola sp.]|uniref:GlxA family transcriptional regulator n=1 Tax=Paraglaciecola sp. TaxID=1920173 RepID=UPI003296AC08
MKSNTLETVSRRVLFVIFEQFELLDLSGPSSVFNGAQGLLKSPSYKVLPVSSSGGLIKSRSGIEVNSQKLASITVSDHDTLIVVGGSRDAIKKVISDTLLQDWLINNKPKAERIGSICSGALVLAAFGFLDNKRATTHWADVAQMADEFPAVNVEPDALYCIDHNIWTSAGVTTGIDMALAMVGQDHHHKIMHEIAKWLVVYVHRPGHQSQFSELLAVQNNHKFSDVLLWLEDNLSKPIKVYDMAAKACLTERTFYRKFTDEIGTSPSKFLEKRRLNRAKLLLEQGEVVKVIHQKVGYQSELGFRKSFVAMFGVSPAMYKKMHCKSCS